jgi:hypothetical protein
MDDLAHSSTESNGLLCAIASGADLRTKKEAAQGGLLDSSYS